MFLYGFLFSPTFLMTSFQNGHISEHGTRLFVEKAWFTKADVFKLLKRLSQYLLLSLYNVNCSSDDGKILVAISFWSFDSNLGHPALNQFE